jgi:hypothetical protein
VGVIEVINFLAWWERFADRHTAHTPAWFTGELG